MEIRVKELCKSYGPVPVLQDVSLTLGTGVTCIMAPSGAGKTTLLRLLLGLERTDGGVISGIEGCRWAAVFQEDRLLEQLDAEGNLRFVLGGDYDAARARKLLAQLNLDNVGEKPVREYSGGMKRRLALARALLTSFDALALDEPFTGLDEENRACAVACIREAAKEKPVLLVTHDVTDAVGLDAKVVHL